MYFLLKRKIVLRISVSLRKKKKKKKIKGIGVVGIIVMMLKIILRWVFNFEVY